MSISLKPVSKNLLFSKNDPSDLRLGDLAQVKTLQELGSENKTWTILGYPDDLGIQQNGGRLGAAQAPDCIRKYFYKMTPGLWDSKLADLGNLDWDLAPPTEPGDALAVRHQAAQSIVSEILLSGSKLITLGGGHDYGFPDAAAFVEHNLKKSGLRPLVINFDAHLDVRPSEKSFHSGTPFYRLLSKYHHQIDFLEVGIQPQCNSLQHRSWADDHHALILDLTEIQKNSLLNSLKSKLAQLKGDNHLRPLWLSVDIDAFQSSEAPGCSQSFTTGLSIQSFLPALSYLFSQYRVHGLGIYEVSPPLDQDDRTSKLAALIMYHSLFAQAGV